MHIFAAMRLTKLEIKGFKSFADQTIINFDENVIGIVGPNGSGKSNIVDAIRWVLGEQKKSDLRLDKMSSVIFNGTSKRKKSGMASVSMSFDNTKNVLPTEYQSVTISRILYRSGESEYQINGVACRLKDIRSMFLDTGIGPDSYAIIALGMVDDILHDKEQSRRFMLEQAAGITKYKVRKRETLQKLKNTEDDLDRVEDLLFEITANLKSLEKQAKRAERYLKIRENYKDLGLQLAKRNLEAIYSELTAVKEKVATEQNQYQEYVSQRNNIDAEIEREKQLQLTEEKKLSEQQKSVNDAIQNTRDLENQKKLGSERLTFLEQHIKRSQESLIQAEEKRFQIETEINLLLEKLDGEKKLEDNLRKDFQVSGEILETTKSRHETVKSELDGFLVNKEENNRQIIDFEKSKAVLQSRIQTLEQSITNLTDRKTLMSEQQKTEKAQFDFQKKKCDQLGSNFAQAEKQLKNRLTELEKLNEVLQTKQRQGFEIKRLLDSKQNEFDLTKSMIDNLEGFPESIQFLAKSQKWSNNAVLLADILYCEKAYRTAVEHYLEPYLNYYVVSNEKEAIDGVKLLTSAQRGKANFFLLNKMKKTALPSVPCPGTPVLDVLEYDSKYTPLFEELLTSVCIVKDIELERHKSGDWILINESGQMILKGTSVSGGSIGLFEGKRIGRKKNLEKLQKELVKLQDQSGRKQDEIQDTEASIARLQSHDLSDQVANLRSELEREERLLIQQKSSLEAIGKNVEDVEQREVSSLEELKNIRIEISGIAAQLDLLGKKNEELNKGLKSMDGDYQGAAVQLKGITEQYNAQHINLIQQENRVKAYQQDLEFKKSKKRDLSAQLEQVKSQISSNTSEKVKLENELKENEEMCISAYKDKDVLMEQLTGAEQHFYKQREALTKLEDNHRRLLGKINDCTVKINELKEKQTRSSFRVTSIQDRVMMEFNAGLEVVNKVDLDDSIGMDILEDKVEKLRNKLQNYGEVNPMAVEAYNEIKERRDHIEQQRADILNAKADLLETITEIEKTATERFLQSFEEVRQNFREVFRSLFTDDDDCDLFLENPEDPLGSNIQITAKPKGKRPQSINQLSGGEKTLTAIAFLFALYLFKPAPFCIFDEVDAPLDDANILKFNKIIKKFSVDSQFVIVTHNKLTMQSVDVIYGIYMPNQGVSRVTGVDFRALQNAEVALTN